MATTRKLLMTAAAAAVLGLGASGNAMAVAYSYATIELQGFTVTTDNVVVLQPGATRNSTTFARYDGYPTTGFGDPVVPPASTDALQATSGPGPFPAENSFAAWWTSKGVQTEIPVGASGGGGARADAYTTAGGAFNGGSVASVQNVSESRVQAPLGGGLTSANESANNSFAGNITLSAQTKFTFNADLLWGLIAETDFADPSAAEESRAEVAALFKITDLQGNELFAFNPFDKKYYGGQNVNLCFSIDGTGDCAKSESTWLEGLNTAVKFSDTRFNNENSVTLAAGNYQVSFSVTSQGAEISIPEPASMALVGLGLAGLAVLRRRKA